MSDHAANPQSLQLTQKQGKREQYPLYRCSNVHHSHFNCCDRRQWCFVTHRNGDVAKLRYRFHKGTNCGCFNCWGDSLSPVYRSISYLHLHWSQDILPCCLPSMVYQVRSEGWALKSCKAARSHVEKCIPCPSSGIWWVRKELNDNRGRGCAIVQASLGSGWLISIPGSASGFLHDLGPVTYLFFSLAPKL